MNEALLVPPSEGLCSLSQSSKCGSSARTLHRLADYREQKPRIWACWQQSDWPRLWGPVIRHSITASICLEESALPPLSPPHPAPLLYCVCVCVCVCYIQQWPLSPSSAGKSHWYSQNFALACGFYFTISFSCSCMLNDTHTDKHGTLTHQSPVLISLLLSPSLICFILAVATVTDPVVGETSPPPHLCGLASGEQTVHLFDQFQRAA